MTETPRRIYVIAEMAWSHDGSVECAEKIVRDAADAGADAISIHITHLPDYMVPHYGAGPGRVSAGKDTKPVYQYLSEINLGVADWERVARSAGDNGLDLLVMPNDRASLEFAESLDPAAYILAAACFEEHDFIAEVGARKRPVYLRVGGATLGEMESAINILNGSGGTAITLLYGHQNYPTGISDTNLDFLTCLMGTFGLPVGIADHIDADDDFALVAPLLAVPLGISCIEKHLTHDRSKRGEDFESALNGDELRLLVERLRKAEQAIGTRHAVGLDASSAAYRQVSRKRLVAARDLGKGDRLTAEMVQAKRSDEGISPAETPFVVGRRLTRDVAKDAGITPDIFET